MLEDELLKILYEIFGKYLFPVLATNFFTDISKPFIAENQQKRILPFVCIGYALFFSAIYGYVEELTLKDIIENAVSIVTLSGIIFLSGAYSSIKKKIRTLIHKDERKDGKDES